MRRLLDIREYREDVLSVAELGLPWDRLREKTLLITGGTGLIGSFLIDVLRMADCGCKVLLAGRNEAKAKDRFNEYWSEDFMGFVRWDAGARALPVIDDAVDMVLHLASNTHPVAYATDPIGTISTNVISLDNLLSLAAERGCERFLYASSNEIYGENRGDVELFDERYCGYIDCNTLRAGYPESKRCGEALCQAYVSQKGLDCVIARLTRTFGPTALPSDTKAVSQFFGNALRGEDIILKSAGTQFYSYMYVPDSVSGLLTVLLKGKTGEAYNVADVTGDITIRELAEAIASCSGRNVAFDIPSATESAGFSRATKARLDGSKLKSLGWTPMRPIREAVARNYGILRSRYSDGCVSILSRDLTNSTNCHYPLPTTNHPPA